jgi:energy-converting hydrogenase B subunit D
MILSVDLAVVILLISLAVGALYLRDLFRSAVLFLVFGLMMAVAWVRLDAADIALAEAAIGAGLVGALILKAVIQMGGDGEEGGPR